MHYICCLLYDHPAILWQSQPVHHLSEHSATDGRLHMHLYTDWLIKLKKSINKCKMCANTILVMSGTITISPPFCPLVDKLAQWR